MRAEPGIGVRVRPLLLAAAMLSAAASARAQGLTGSFQAQFQRFERLGLVANPDGTFRTTKVTRELWVQTYDFNHQTYLRSDLLLQSNFRYTDLAHVGRAEGSRSPFTSVRLTHPWFGLRGSHEPNSTRGLLSAEGVGAATDTTATLEVTSRTQDTSVGGNVGVPGWPRLDVTWIRRHRDRDAVAGEATAVQRFARMTYDRGPLSLHGSLGDQRRNDGQANRAGVLSQRNLSAGGSWQIAPWRSTRFHLLYDLSDARTPRSGGTDVRSRSHSASVSGERRESEKLVWNLNYNLHRFSGGTARTPAPTDQDGSLVLNYAPARAVRWSGGGGVRTARRGETNEWARYLTTVLAADGRVRERWTGAASVSHTSTWDRSRGVTHLETAQLGTQLRLVRGLSADANAQISSQSDSSARADRSSRELTLRVQAAPLRSLSFGIAERHYQVGPGLTVASGRARTRAIDGRWVPLAAVEVIGSHSVSGTLPFDRPRVTTDMARLRLSPASSLQFIGSWSRSTESRADLAGGGIAGREILTGRVVAALSSNLSCNAGISVADRGTSRESRQLDAAVVMGFRR